MAQVFQVLAHQCETNLPFGLAAKDLKFLTRRQIADLLLLQTEQTPALHDILVEMGAVSQDLVDHELAASRQQGLQSSKQDDSTSTKKPEHCTDSTGELQVAEGPCTESSCG